METLGETEVPQRVRCHFDIAANEPDRLVLRDIGGELPVPSVTNDAEAVVETLAAYGSLPAGRRLYYIDSDGKVDEIVHEGGKFVRFAPGPAPGSRW